MFTIIHLPVPPISLLFSSPSNKHGEAKANGSERYAPGSKAEEKDQAGLGNAVKVQSQRDVSSSCTSCKENTEHSGAYINTRSSDLLVLSWCSLQLTKSDLNATLSSLLSCDFQLSYGIRYISMNIPAHASTELY